MDVIVLVRFVTVRAGGTNGFTLVNRRPGVAHDVIGIVAIGAAHAGQIMGVGRQALHGASISESQLCLIGLRQTNVAQRNAARTRMAAEAPGVGNIRREGRVSVFGVLGDVACKAAATPAVCGADGVHRLRVAKVAACTLLAQHRIRDAVPQRGQGSVSMVSVGPVYRLARRVYHAAPGIHETAADRRDAIGVAGATGAIKPACAAASSREVASPP